VGNGGFAFRQLKVMSAIETCRTAALGGHVERCEDCAHERTHRVAISNSRLLILDDAGVTFKWKDYRIKGRDSNP
jgi:Transposase zinc-binding domain/Putative transposase